MSQVLVLASLVLVLVLACQFLVNITDDDRTCQGLDRQGQGQGPSLQGPSLQRQGLDLQGQGQGQAQGLTSLGIRGSGRRGSDIFRDIGRRIAVATREPRSTQLLYNV